MTAKEQVWSALHFLDIWVLENLSWSKLWYWTAGEANCSGRLKALTYLEWHYKCPPCLMGHVLLKITHSVCSGEGHNEGKGVEGERGNSTRGIWVEWKCVPGWETAEQELAECLAGWGSDQGCPGRRGMDCAAQSHYLLECRVRSWAGTRGQCRAPLALSWAPSQQSQSRAGGKAELSQPSCAAHMSNSEGEAGKGFAGDLLGWFVVFKKL